MSPFIAMTLSLSSIVFVPTTDGLGSASLPVSVENVLGSRSKVHCSIFAMRRDIS